MRLTAQQKIEIAEAIERIAFAPAQPEPKPWKCKRCGESLADGEDHLRPLYHPGHFAYTCQRPEPKREPAATVDKGRGLYNKFIVDRADGKSEPGEKHYGCEYFVLDLTHDKFAQPALRAYAEACSGEFPQLADDLFKKCDKPGPEREEKVCPNCKKVVMHKNIHTSSFNRDTFTCKPAPVAGELAEVVYSTDEIVVYSNGMVGSKLSKTFRERLLPNELRGLIEHFRSQATAQTVAGGMSEELERVLEYAEAALRHDVVFNDITGRADILAVRAQAASAQPGRDLPKVREFIQLVRNRLESGGRFLADYEIGDLGRYSDAALAELDAQPKAVGVPPNVRELVSLLLWKIRNNQGSIAIEHYGGLLIEAQKEIDCWPERVEK